MALELGLAHPLAAADAFRNRHRNAVAGGDFILGSKAAAPVAGRIPGLYFQGGTLPEVGVSFHIVAGRIQGFDLGFGFISAASFRYKFIVPGNAVRIVGGFHEGRHLKLLLHIGRLAVHQQVAGLLNNALVRHVGHLAAGGQHQIDFFDAGIVPVAFKGILGSAELGAEQVVLIGRLVLGLVLGTLVGVAIVVYGIVGVLSVGGEGHNIVIEETLLAACLAGPPALGIVQGRTAAEVAVHGTVPYPVLASVARNGVDVRSGIEGVTVGVFHREGLDHGSLGDAVGVVGLYLNGVLAGLAESEGNAVLGVRVFLGGLSVNLLLPENPDGNHPFVIHRKGDIVGFLIHLNGHIQVGGLRKATGRGFRIGGRTGGHDGSRCRQG